MTMQGRSPKPNARRHAGNKGQPNIEVPAGRLNKARTARVRARIRSLHPAAAEWGLATLSSPQAAQYTDAEVTLVEAGAVLYDGWLTAPPSKRRTSDFAEFSKLNDKLLNTPLGRLRAHIEMVVDSSAGVPDEVAAMRAVRDRAGPRDSAGEPA